MTDSKLAQHYQRIVDSDLVNSDCVKIVDPPRDDPFPGRKTIGRMFMPDAESNALVWQGQGGAEQWLDRWLPEFNGRPYIHAWEGPNEEHPLWDAKFRRQSNKFTSHLAVMMAHHGLRLVGHNWSVGWPDKGHAPDFRESMTNLFEFGHYLGLHEYAAPAMWNGDGWWTLRYRRTFKELRGAGIPIPNVLIGECGIDGGVIGRPKTGWRTYTTPADYMVQLAWYNEELCKDPEIKAAFVFTSGPHMDWLDFDFNREMSERLNRYNAAFVWEPEQPKPEPVVVGPGKPEVVDLVGKLKRGAGDFSDRRFGIDQIVIHHTGANAVIKHPKRYIKAVARYHVGLGWPGIGYHFCVDQSGGIWQTQPVGVESYHAGGDENWRSIGVCLLGNFTKRDPSDAQLDAAKRLCDWLGYKVVPHKSIVPTACPGRWHRWGNRITGGEK